MVLMLIIISMYGLIADPVDVNDAQQVAYNLYVERSGREDLSGLEIIETFIETEDSLNIYYIFNFNQIGYMLVAADFSVFPVLMYSFETDYSPDDNPEYFIELLDHFKELVIYIKENNIEPTEDIQNEWIRLNVDSNDFVPDLNFREVEPLLTTSWHQYSPYNDECPYETIVGCVAVAQGQFMKYWYFPFHGSGTHSYIPNTYPDLGEQYADFENTYYDWDDMPDSINEESDPGEIYAIANFLHQCGVSVNMDYGWYHTGGSSAGFFSISYALETYFYYDSDYQNLYFDDFTLDEWNEILQNELDNSRPVPYAHNFPNHHARVIDGYQGEYHFHENSGGGGGGSYFYVEDYLEYDHRAIINLTPEQINSDFTAVSSQEGEFPLMVLFEDISILLDHNFPYNVEPISCWQWDFNSDGIIDSELQTDVFTYDEPGLYDVTLTVSNGTDTDTITKLNYIYVYDTQPILYVDALNGSDENDGTEENPFVTIQKGVDEADYYDDVVIVKPGTYNENINFNGKCITLKSSDGPENTIIDGSNPVDPDLGSVVIIENCIAEPLVFDGFTIENGIGIIDYVNQQFPENYGGGLYIIDSFANLNNIVIKNNNAEQILDYSFGGGIASINSNLTIENTRLISNTSQSYGGAIYCRNSELEIINSTISDNFCRTSGGVYCLDDNNILITNTIIWDNQSNEVYLSNSGNQPNFLNVSYSDIEGGLQDINNIGENTINWLEGNIDADPEFFDPENNDYSLSWTSEGPSPCIDTGNPDTDGDGTEFQFDAVDQDPDETRIDMGAIYFPHSYEVYKLPGLDFHHGWKWMCFSVIDDRTDGYNVILNMLDQVIDYVQQVVWREEDGEELIFEWNLGGWLNDDHIITSPQGYKVQMNVESGISLPVSGFLCPPDTEFDILANIGENWIGYFIELTQGVDIAFYPHIENLYMIKTQFWTMIRADYDPESPWICSTEKPTLSYGDMVAVIPFSDINNFTWNNIESTEAYVRPEPENFSFEEKSDYIPVFVEHDPDNPPLEIGIIINETCKGAAVVEDSLTQINAYIIGEEGEEIEFELYYGRQNTSNRISEYLVYDPETKLKEKRKITNDNKNDYYLVSFNQNESSDNTPKKFVIKHYPNPFNLAAGKGSQTTTFQYILPEQNEISLNIYNIKGQKIKELVNCKQEPGIYHVNWDGKDEFNKPVSSGIYFYSLKTRTKTLNRKMLLLR